MRHIVEVGTDVATVCFFDPTALPVDFDQKIQKHHSENFKGQFDAGNIWCQDTGADGAYLFHFYVDSEIPAKLKRYLREPKESAQFHVPGGEIWALGAEYAAKSRVELERKAHMGGRFELPAGVYSLTAWRTEWPQEDFVEEETDRRAGKDPHAKTKQRIGCWIVPSGFLSFCLLLASIVHTFLRNKRALLFWTLTFLLAGIAWFFLWWHNRLAKLEDPARLEVAKEYPSIVVQLRRLKPEA